MFGIGPAELIIIIILSLIILGPKQIIEIVLIFKKIISEVQVYFKEIKNHIISDIKDQNKKD